MRDFLPLFKLIWCQEELEVVKRKLLVGVVKTKEHRSIAFTIAKLGEEEATTVIRRDIISHHVLAQLRTPSTSTSFCAERPPMAPPGRACVPPPLSAGSS
jgi:hypothetical protein